MQSSLPSYVDFPCFINAHYFVSSFGEREISRHLDPINRLARLRYYYLPASLSRYFFVRTFVSAANVQG